MLYSFEVFGREVFLPTYGVLVATGFLVGTWIATRELHRNGHEVRLALDACLWALVGGFLGAHALFVLTNLGEYAALCRGGGAPRSPLEILSDCTSALHVWSGGIVYYGGVGGGLLATWIYTRRNGVALLPLADALAPALALGHAWGRLGCYFVGCCFGRSTGTAWGAKFPPGSIAFDELVAASAVPHGATRTPPLHPSQLYEAAGELALLSWLLYTRSHKRLHGEVFATYLIGYAALRFGLEYVRGDAARKFVVPGWLSTSQALSLLAVGASWVMWKRLRTESA